MRVEEAPRSVDRGLLHTGPRLDAVPGGVFPALSPTTDEPLARIATGSSVDVYRAFAHALQHCAHGTNVRIHPG